MIEFNKLYKTKEAAEILNMNQQVIVRKLGDWDIVWIKVGKVWRIRGTDLNKYLWAKSTVETEKISENGVSND